MKQKRENLIGLNLKCFCCLKSLKSGYLVACEDDQLVYVGPECFKSIKESNGYQPKIGPRLFTLENDPNLSRR